MVKLSEADREALERALQMAQASDDPRFREQIERKLKKDGGWYEAASTASYHFQVRLLQLRPWQSPPCYGDVVSLRGGDRAVARALLRRLLDSGLSRFEPDVLQAIEARAHGDAPAA